MIAAAVARIACRIASLPMRREFIAGLLAGLRVVWPILSGLLVAIVALGVIVGILERWSVHESIYFAFVSALAPKRVLARTLAVLIGVCGVLFTALVAAVAVKALEVTRRKGDE